MKKLALFTIALFATTGIAFSQSLSATGDVLWDIGYDIDHHTSGFEVKFKNLKFDVSLMDKDTVEKTGDTLPYGEIRITGLTVGTTNGTDDETNYVTPSAIINDDTDWGKRAIYLQWAQLSSKLVFTENFNIVLWYDNDYRWNHAMNFTTYNGDTYGIQNAYVYKIYSGTYGSTDNSKTLYNDWEDVGDSDNIEHNKVFFDASNYTWNAPTTNAYVTANYSIPSIVDLSAQVGSYMTYSNTARYYYDSNGDIVNNDLNVYSTIFNAKVTCIPNLTAVLAAAATVGASDVNYTPPAFGGKLQYNLPVTGDIVLKPSIYADCQLPDCDTYGGAFESTDELDYAVAAGVEADFYKSILTLNGGYGIDADTTGDASTLRATAALKFLTIEDLTLKAAVEYVNDNFKDGLDGTSSVAYHAYISYDIYYGPKAQFTPWVEFSSSNYTSSSTYDLYGKAGVDIAGIMANTVFSLLWDSNDLSGNYNTYDDANFGRVVFRTKVSF